MFTLEQFKAVILENEKLQKEIDLLKEQLGSQKTDQVPSFWKQRALIAEAQLEALNRKKSIELISQEDKWSKIDLLIDSNADNLLNLAINLHIELFNLGIKTAKKEIIEKYFILDSQGNYIKK